MLGTRVIPVVLYDGTQAVKSTKFRDHRNVGSVMQVARVYESRQVDELVFLDIAARERGNGPSYRVIETFARELSCPFTVGGGVRDISDAKSLFSCGADKVCVGVGARDWVGLVSEIAAHYGSQAVVASVDVRLALVRGATPRTDYREMLRRLETAGVGEILLTDAEREGMMQGMNPALVAGAVKATTVPVIANGGAGKPEHLVEVVKAGANAVAASSIFHFTETTPMDVKDALKSAGFTVRL